MSDEYWLVDVVSVPGGDERGTDERLSLWVDQKYHIPRLLPIRLAPGAGPVLEWLRDGWVGQGRPVVIVETAQRRAELAELLGALDMPVRCSPFTPEQREIVDAVQDGALAEWLLSFSESFDPQLFSHEIDVVASQMRAVAERTLAWPRLTVACPSARQRLVVLARDDARYTLVAGPLPARGEALTDWLERDHPRLHVPRKPGHDGGTWRLQSVTSTAAAEDMAVGVHALRASGHVRAKARTVAFTATLDCLIGEEPVKLFVFPDPERLKAWIEREAAKKPEI